MNNSTHFSQEYVNQASDIIIATEKTGRIIYANESAINALGYENDEIMRMKILNIVEGLSRSFAVDLFRNFIREGGWKGEILLSRKDGRIFPAYVSASPVKEPGGEMSGLLVIARDISESKQVEEDIRKRADLANSIIRSAPIGILTLDQKGIIKAANLAVTEMLGTRHPNALINQKFEVIESYFNPDLIPLIKNGLKGHESGIYNIPLTKDDAREIVASMIVVPIKNRDGILDGVCLLIENRTSAVIKEQKLLQADKLASIGFLTAGIAHEINNPLAGIRSIVDLLEGRIRREKGNTEPYEHIKANIDRISEIIRQLLEFGNPASLDPAPADLNQITKQILGLFKYHKYYRRIEIIWNLDEGIPMSVMDQKQIQQVIHNLAMNAAQAMKESGGKLFITTKYVKASEEGSGAYLELRMRDTGPGIKNEIIRRIFDPFFTTKPTGEGTGLGLSVSHSIAKNHGGDLKARNHPDGGAEFVLTLPVVMPG